MNRKPKPPLTKKKAGKNNFPPSFAEALANQNPATTLGFAEAINNLNHSDASVGFAEALEGRRDSGKSLGFAEAIESRYDSNPSIGDAFSQAVSASSAKPGAGKNE